MERIGFVGLGIMGRPMVKNLLAAGYDVAVWNRSRPGIDDCVAAGATEAASPAAVAAACDVFISMVTDSPDVEAVISGPGGAIEGPGGGRARHRHEHHQPRRHARHRRPAGRQRRRHARRARSPAATPGPSPARCRS